MPTFTLHNDYHRDIIISTEGNKALLAYLIKQKVIHRTVKNLPKRFSLCRRRAICILSENPVIVIRFRPKYFNWPTLIHELLHSLKSIMEQAGMPLSDDSEEGWAYQIESLAQQCSQFIN